MLPFKRVLGSLTSQLWSVDILLELVLVVVVVTEVVEGLKSSLLTVL